MNANLASEEAMEDTSDSMDEVPAEQPAHNRPGFLSALGLHPASEHIIKRTPEKTIPLLYNRRGTVSCALLSMSPN